MKVPTTLVRNGNSWSIRLSKAILQASSIKPGEELIIKSAPGRVIIYSSQLTEAQQDKFKLAKQDARQAWDEAFDQVWFEIFGPDDEQDDVRT